MKIIYKEPYWVKFEWEMSEHHDNQYVTLFDKKENEIYFQWKHPKYFKCITISFDKNNRLRLWIIRRIEARK